MSSGAVLVQESVREVGPTESLQVHREKGDVGESIAEAQSLIEFQAVQDRGDRREDRTHRRRAGRHARRGPGAPRCVRRTTRPDRPDSSAPVPAISAEAPGYSTSSRSHRSATASRVAAASIASPVGAALMKRRNQFREPAKAGDGVAAFHERRKPPVLRHPSHDDDVVNRVAAAVGDHFDAEVDVRGEAAIQRDFALAVAEPQFRRREINEGVVHLLLELVHTLTLECEDRDVGVEGGNRYRRLTRVQPSHELFPLLAVCRHASRVGNARPVGEGLPSSLSTHRPKPTGPIGAGAVARGSTRGNREMRSTP